MLKSKLTQHTESQIKTKKLYKVVDRHQYDQSKIMNSSSSRLPSLSKIKIAPVPALQISKALIQ